MATSATNQRRRNAGCGDGGFSGSIREFSIFISLFPAVFHIQYSLLSFEFATVSLSIHSLSYVSLFFFSPALLFLRPAPAAMSAPGPSSSDVLKKAFPHVDIDGHNLPPSPAPSSPRAGKGYAIATELVYTESNDQYNASSVPIYQV